jgi:DNA-binding transcriptional LysR family regulator
LCRADPINRTAKNPIQTIHPFDHFSRGRMLDALTLDQLRMLVAIADAGGFTAAARRGGGAPNPVSHAIAVLEAELGLTLFDRTSRRPRLTEGGQAVLAEARLALARVEQLRSRARGMAQGVEREITLAVTVLAPLPPLFDALEAFRRRFPGTPVELHVEEIGGSAVLVQEGACRLGITGTPSLRMVPPGALATIPLGATEVVAVVAAHHPLAAARHKLTEADLRDHCQLVPTSRAGQPFPFTLAAETWRVANMEARRDMILRGIGWGTLPRHLVTAELAEGRLVELSLAARAAEMMRIELFAIHRIDTPPGRAGRWLVEAFSAAMAKVHDRGPPMAGGGLLAG